MPPCSAFPPGVAVAWVARPAKGHRIRASLFHPGLRAPGEDPGLPSRMAPDGVLWVSWPKKSSGVPTDITEDVIREAALPTGLVDVKVCAVDETWSGLKLMIRRELR